MQYKTGNEANGKGQKYDNRKNLENDRNIIKVVGKCEK